MTIWRSIVVSMLLCSGPAGATVLRLCTDIHSHLPYLTPEGGGSIGALVAVAAREAGFRLEYRRVPLTRCVAEAQSDLAHGYAMAPYVPELQNLVDYPMRNGAPDPARATTRARIMLYCRSGAAVTWNGAVIGGLRRPVLVPNAGLSIQGVLARLRIPFDKRGQSTEVNFAKLLAGRGDCVASPEEEGSRLMRLPMSSGKIDMLPLPLFEQSYYLVISKAFYAQHRAAVEAMWNAIGRQNGSP